MITNRNLQNSIYNHTEMITESYLSSLNVSTSIILSLSSSSPPHPISINYKLPEMIVVAVVLFLMVIGTAFGNLLVAVALFKFRSLRTISNYLIGNLALSDFLLAVTILPFSALNEVLGYWVVGRILCNFWLTADVLYCTASIWNLAFIGLDRFTATLYPVWYREKRNTKQAAIYITTVWLLSISISVPALLGWQDISNTFQYDDKNDVYKCELFSTKSYVLYSASGSFFIPFLITVFLYIRIFIVLRKRMLRMRRQRRSKPSVNMSSVSAAASNKKKSKKKNKKEQQLLVVEMAKVDDNMAAGGDGEDDEFKNGLKPQKTTADMATQSTAGATTTEDECLVVMLNKDDLATNDSSNNSMEDGSIITMTTKKEKKNNTNKKTSTTSSTTTTTTPTPPNTFKLKNPLRKFLKKKTNTKKQSTTSSILPHNKSSSAATVTTVAAATASSSTAGILEKKRYDQKEIRATIRMAIIIACFCGCWLGFFVIYVVRAWCVHCPIPRIIDSFFFWLGYANSSMNPILYTIFNDDFRKAFQKLLGCYKSGGAGRRFR